ncbi:hypothetical protein AMK21_27365 [Streptomyces sp. CB00316]|uniref:hypothetical protein n=1 Tax=unclassified Streptomyces TaxID=2593676 RepID=UPI00093F7935|nr:MULTISPECIES: hypothetical protein [unclassified Streptomyces]MBT2378398.1 hypothetical protein [Streptomyces sp. ISL-111]OKJ16529.1 hypothetical protein AMK21_27365 [Streptomyces sp. CB00316]
MSLADVLDPLRQPLVTVLEAPVVRTAQDHCERLTVLVCAASVESVPLDELLATGWDFTAPLPEKR